MSVCQDYLKPTKIIDSDHPSVIEYAAEINNGKTGNPAATAIALYYRVRDDIKYNPYVAYHRPESYQASIILKQRKGYCVSKASLLCALGRCSGIPSRLGFATVRNHIATKQLLDLLGTNEFIYHGYTEFYLDGQWRIATPAFDKTTCVRHGVEPLEFNGRDDSKLQLFNREKKLFMEYLEEQGSYADVPVEEMMLAFRKKYGDQLVDKWIHAFEAMRGIATRNFEKEDIVS